MAGGVGPGDSVTTSCGKALPLVGGSGSCLRVRSHDVNGVISGVFIVGYILGVDL